jgi:hypothetical protein
MRSLSCLAALAVAACNTPQSGVNDRIDFTPTQCGAVSGCAFDDGIGKGGVISVQISGIGAQPTAGLDLASRHPNIMTVARRADIGNAPAWDLTGLAQGFADLAAVDTDGVEIDHIQVEIHELRRLTMIGFVGDIVETSAPDFDEAFIVNADQQVSWLIRPVAPLDHVPMGRFTYETVGDLGAFELENSDRPNGHLSVNLPAGEYPIEFQLSVDPDNIFVSALITATAP